MQGRIVSMVGVVVLLVLGTLPVGAKQEATPASSADHPFIGSWWVDTEPENPDNPPHLAVVSSDGTYLEVDPDGTAIGVWEATSDSTASVTFHFLLGPEGGTGTVRADAVEVAPDGQSWTATYTIELVDPDGASSGEIGPGTAEGTRLSVEPQGTPVGTLEDVFGAPEATPAD